MEDHDCDRDGALEEFQRSSRRLLPEQSKQSQIWSHLRPERRYPEQFPLIFTVLPKGSEGSRRPPGDGRSVLTGKALPPGGRQLPGHKKRLHFPELARRLLLGEKIKIQRLFPREEE